MLRNRNARDATYRRFPNLPCRRFPNRRRVRIRERVRPRVTRGFGNPRHSRLGSLRYDTAFRAFSRQRLLDRIHLLVREREGFATRRTAGFQTCCVADFQIGGASEFVSASGLA